jgi:hypothetical protein
MQPERYTSNYRGDLRAARQRLAAQDSSVVSTPSGRVQYADRGTGPPVLAIHGIMSGFDAGLRNVCCHIPDASA